MKCKALHPPTPAQPGIQPGPPLSRGRARNAAALIVSTVLLIVSSGAQAADDALYAAAKKEGQVVWYTSLIVNQAVRPLVEAFNDRWVQVKKELFN